MEAQSLLCVNCAAPPPDGQDKWSCCKLCAKLKLPATYYCGEECMKVHWPKHRQWHKEQKEFVAHTVSHVLQGDRARAEALSRDAEVRDHDGYKQYAEAYEIMAKGDNHGAAKAFRKIIAEEPWQPGPYYNLGVILVRSGRAAEAAPMFLKAMEIYPITWELKDRTKHWARSVASAFDVLKNDACSDLPKPDWWNDEALMELSARVLAEAPDECGAMNMRANVLGHLVAPCHDRGPPFRWDVVSRTCAEIKEAATLYRRAAARAVAISDKERFANLARICDKAAVPYLAKEEAEAKAARAAAVVAQAEEEKTREAAEAKAMEAAEALLAEEEKEKMQTVVSTQASKAKGKKGKGKGKR